MLITFRKSCRHRPQMSSIGKCGQPLAWLNKPGYAFGGRRIKHRDLKPCYVICAPPSGRYEQRRLIWKVYLNTVSRGSLGDAGIAAQVNSSQSVDVLYNSIDAQAHAGFLLVHWPVRLITDAMIPYARRQRSVHCHATGQSGIAVREWSCCGHWCLPNLDFVAFAVSQQRIFTGTLKVIAGAVNGLDMRVAIVSCIIYCAIVAEHEVVDHDTTLRRSITRADGHSH